MDVFKKIISRLVFQRLGTLMINLSVLLAGRIILDMFVC